MMNGLKSMKKAGSISAQLAGMAATVGLAIVASVVMASADVAYNYITLHVPGAEYTAANGIEGNNIVGTYSDSSWFAHGFLYNGTTYQTLDVPSNEMTVADDISGSNIVGAYWEFWTSLDPHGFLFDGTTYQTFDIPGAQGTSLNGISGNNIVGEYTDAGGNGHGFLYNGTTYQTLDVPGAQSTIGYGIDGSNIVGEYTDAGGTHGFLYNGTTYQTLDVPGAQFTVASGISGNNIVGWYRDAAWQSHGFLYNGTTYQTLDFPGADYTAANGIYGSNIVGDYSDAAGGWHGFLATPATHSLTINKSGSGTGRITSEPAGIDCGTSCPSQTADFVQLTQVTLTAQAGAGSTFHGWITGPCSGTGQCVVTMESAVTVGAQFTDNGLAKVPNLSEWGAVVCAFLIAVSAFWLIRRRQHS